MISSQLPALQVVLPLVAAPLCILFHNRTFAWLLMVFVSLVSFGISCALFNQVLVENTITYAMGGWVAPWGIEYYIDKLTTYMLLIVNGVAVLVSLGARESIEDEISSDRIYLFYTAFLLNLTGLLGVIITGDAFNLFVFILGFFNLYDEIIQYIHISYICIIGGIIWIKIFMHITIIKPFSAHIIKMITCLQFSPPF